MKHYSCRPVIFFAIFIIFSTHITSQEVNKKYVWQSDDSHLIANLSDKNTFLSFSPFESEPISAEALEREIRGLEHLKNIVSGWRPIQLPEKSKPKLTQTAKEKKKQADIFLKEQFDLALKGELKREIVVETLLKWQPDKIAFLLENPLLDKFISNRFEKKDSKTLYVLATLLDKAGRERDRDLETKALDILVKIKKLPHVNRAITQAIAEHIESLRQNDPWLEAYYNASMNPLTQAPMVFPSLGWLPEDKSLSNLQPQVPTVKPIPESVTPTKPAETPAVAATNSSVNEKNSPPVSPAPSETSGSPKKSRKKKTAPAQKEDESVNIDELVTAYKKAYSTGHYQESVDKAWQVIKHTAPDSAEYKHAAARIDLISKIDFIHQNGAEKALETTKQMHPKHPHLMQALERSNRLQKKINGKEIEINEAVQSALYCKVLLHKNGTDPSEAISYFMKAQDLREGTLIEEPEETDATTFAALSNKITNVVVTRNPQMTEVIDFITQLANQGNQQALQAMAIHHHKTAMANPSMQLLCLRLASSYLNRLDNKITTSAPKNFDPRQIYFDYYQQLYVFARLDEHAKVKDFQTGKTLASLPKYFQLTRFIAEACNGLKLVDSHPKAAAWRTKAQLLLKGNLYKIHKNLRAFLTQMDSSSTDTLPEIYKMILYGANGLPLSIGQRKLIIDDLKRKRPQEALIRFLNSEKYEDTCYQRAALKEGKPYSDDYYRMLFALDTGNFKEALPLARKLSNEHKDFRADMFIKNILSCTDLVFQTDAARIPAIKTLFNDVMSHDKIMTLLPVYCDAMQIVEDMAARNFVPAIELLLDAHCADEYKGTHQAGLITLFDRTKDLIRTSTTPVAIPHLTREDFYLNLTSFCGMNETMEPLWSYTGCLLESLMVHKDYKTAEPAAALVQKIAEGIEADIKAEKKGSVFFVTSAARSQLSERVRALVSDKANMKQLQLTESYGVVLKLHFALHPEEKDVHSEAKQMADEVFQELIATFLDPTAPLTDHILDDGNTDTVLERELADVPKISSTRGSKKGPSITSVQTEEYLNSPNFQARCRMEDLRKREDFKLYKEQYGNEKIEISTKDKRSRIQDLLLLAGHKFMLAQADSPKPLKILQVPEVILLIQQAIAVHPVLSYLEIANALFYNTIWPSDIKEGEKYLHTALAKAETHKLSAQESASLQHTKRQYATYYVSLGMMTASKLFSDPVQSTKKMSKVVA